MELITWLLIKHFICDFPLQNAYMYLNKGKYGHWGGIVHSLVHFIGSFLVLVVVAPDFWGLSFIDGIVHYHIDFAKVWVNQNFNLKPDTSKWYWILLGYDQLLHQVTYILMATLVRGSFV